MRVAWKHISLLLVIILTLSSLSSCKPSSKQKFTEYSFDFFDTVTTVTGYEDSRENFDAKVGKVLSLLSEYHKLFDIYHTYEGVTNLATINDSAGTGVPLTVDDKLIEFLEYSKEMCSLTNGKTNIAMGSVLSVWHKYRDMGSSNPTEAELPSIDELVTAKQKVSIDFLIINREERSVMISDKNASLDVGAIAKGYAVEKAAELLTSLGAESYVLNVGGNVRTVGTKPDGDGWVVGIQSPDVDSGSNEYIEYIKITDMSLVTSGSYQRYYVVDGKRYHHIIDPETLFPSEYYLSVSVLCKDSGMADALSTALFVMPPTEAIALVETLSGVEAMFVLPDGEILYSSSFKEYSYEMK